jgi:hypothetical protein
MSQARELMSQRKILGGEICPIFEDGSDSCVRQRQLERHQANQILSTSVQKKSEKSRSYRIKTMLISVLALFDSRLHG